MPTCSHCGFEVTPRQHAPVICPQCGTPWAAAAGVGLPPRFIGGDPGSTLFGVPGDPEREDSMLGDLSDLKADLKAAVPARTTSRPPPPPPPRFHFAPPPLPRSSTPESAAPNEFDLEFESESSALELELPELTEDSGPMDLPTPAGVSPRALQIPQPAEDLDLPVPSARGPMLPRLPPPPPSAALENLPMPAGGTSPRSLNLPPVPSSARTPGADLPLEDEEEFDLLAPLELDLPGPRDSGGPAIPHPSFAGEENLPRPALANGNLLQPARAEVEPREQRVRPAGLWMTPAEQRLQPKDQFLIPAEQSLQPITGMLQPKAGGVAGQPQARGEGSEPSAASSIRAPRMAAGLGSPRASRLWVAAGLGVLALVGGGAGAYYAGIFDPEDTSQRGAPELSGAATPKPDGPVDRSEAVLEFFRRDEIASYRQALTLATEQGDTVGQAEAALLLHLRYGPDGVLLGQARELLGPVASVDAPFVRRVLGLDALARGDHAAAEAAWVGEEPRTRLYRGMLRLAQEHFEAAATEAEAALAAHDDDVAALSSRHAANLAMNPRSELPLLRKSVAQHSSHGILRELAARAALEQGLLAEAQTLAAAIDTDDTAPAGYQARLEGLQGRIAAARGQTVLATRHLDRALTLDPKSLELGLARVELLLESGELVEASRAAKSLAKAHPKSLRAAALVIETDIAGGRGDEALASLATLAEAHPDAAIVPLLEGKVQAMRLQLEPGDAAFAKALERDPKLTQAVIAQARMHAAARQPAQALAQLDAKIEETADAEARVDLLLARAELLAATQAPDAALAALDTALELDPQHNRAQTQRGILRLRQGMNQEGRQDLMAVFERTGGFRGMTAPLGRILSREGNIERLEALVGNQVEDPRADPEVKLVGVRLRLLQGNSEAAKALAQEVLTKEPSNWEAHMLLADAYRQSRDYPEALERINLAQPPEPNAELFLLKGKILEFNGRYAEARPEYQRALAVDPSLSEARFLYGRSLAYAGAGKAAITELSQVIRETGTRYPAAYAAIGRAQKELGNYSQAVASLAKATDLDPAQYEAWYHKGTVHAFKNQHREAADALVHAVAEEASSNEWYPDAWVRLGRAQFHMGDKAAAREALEKYLAIAPAQHASRGEAQRLLRELG